VALASLITILYLPIKEHGTPIRPDILFVCRVLFPFAIALFYYTVLKNDVIKKVFSVGAIPVIGGMCYSVYLVHYTIISIFGRYTINLQIGDTYLANMLFQLGLLLVPVLLLSAVFYYFIERPFMDGKWTDMLLKKKDQQ
jgi:peptidoglycan/LPS O-acetylase OafA/YrhL